MNHASPTTDSDDDATSEIEDTWIVDYITRAVNAVLSLNISRPYSLRIQRQRSPGTRVNRIASAAVSDPFDEDDDEAKSVDLDAVASSLQHDRQLRKKKPSMGSLGGSRLSSPISSTATSRRQSRQPHSHSGVGVVPLTGPDGFGMRAPRRIGSDLSTIAASAGGTAAKARSRRQVR